MIDEYKYGLANKEEPNDSHFKNLDSQKTTEYME